MGGKRKGRISVRGWAGIGGQEASEKTEYSPRLKRYQPGGGRFLSPDRRSRGTEEATRFETGGLKQAAAAAPNKPYPHAAAAS